MESYYIVESNDGQQRAGVISGKSHTVIWSGLPFQTVLETE
jgi:hypothetical protein